jgi:hypothetical protein
MKKILKLQLNLKMSLITITSFPQADKRTKKQEETFLTVTKRSNHKK